MLQLFLFGLREKKKPDITTGERGQFPNSVSKNDFDIIIAGFWAKVKLSEKARDLFLLILVQKYPKQQKLVQSIV